jgi:hypothetical protein
MTSLNLVEALGQLGPTYVGVIQLPVSVSDKELLKLNQAGIRALRFNLKRGGSEGLRHLDTLARRVHEVVGWHAELHVDSQELSTIYETLIELPAVSIRPYHLIIRHYQLQFPNRTMLILTRQFPHLLVQEFRKSQTDCSHHTHGQLELRLP